MAANMYARSIFGEDALANLSIEKPLNQGPDATVIGHIRIRAKTQVSTGVAGGGSCISCWLKFLTHSIVVV